MNKVRKRSSRRHPKKRKKNPVYLYFGFGWIGRSVGSTMTRKKKITKNEMGTLPAPNKFLALSQKSRLRLLGSSLRNRTDRDYLGTRPSYQPLESSPKTAIARRSEGGSRPVPSRRIGRSVGRWGHKLESSCPSAEPLLSLARPTSDRHS